MTGCINPTEITQTVLIDIAQRKAQYIAAIRFYLKETDLPIVFAENSDCDISEHFTEVVASNRLEILTFNGNNYDKAQGKGLGEALIIEYALSHSRLLSKGDIILKITGRIQIANIQSLLRFTPASLNSLFSDYSTKSGEQNLLKSVIVQAPIEFWRLFLSHELNINDSIGIYFEHILKYTADEWYTMGHTYTYFPFPIFYKGFSGSTGHTYEKKYPRLNWFIKFMLYHLWFKWKIHRH